MSAITSTPNNQVVTFQKSPITFVPRDVMLLIFKQYFGAADMAALSRVCRTWNTYANDAGLWNLLLMRAFPNAGKASINPKQTYKELVTCSNMEKGIFATKHFVFNYNSIKCIPSNSNENFFVSSLNLDSDRTSMQVWDFESEKFVKTFKDIEGSITSVKLSKPLNRLISHHSAEHALKVWDFETSKLLKTIPSPISNGICSYILTNDGKQLIASFFGHADKNEIQIWDLQNLVLLKTLDTNEHPVTAFTASRDGALIIYLVDGTIHIWDSKTDSTTTFQSHDITTLFFHEDKNLIITGNQQGQVAFREPDTGNSEIVLTGNDSPVKSFKISKEGHLISMHEDCMIIWDMDSRMQIEKFDNKDTNWPRGDVDVIISKNEQSHILVGENGKLRIRNAKTKQCFNLPLISSSTNGVILTDDGKLTYLTYISQNSFVTLDFCAPNAAILRELADVFQFTTSSLPGVVRLRITEALNRFERMPAKIKEEIFIELDKILPQNQSIAHDSQEGREEEEPTYDAKRGERAFFNRGGLSSTGKQKADAILNYLNRKA